MRKKSKMSPLTAPVQHCPGYPRECSFKKEIKGWERIKSTLFTDGITDYVENYKESITKSFRK